MVVSVYLDRSEDEAETDGGEGRGTSMREVCEFCVGGEQRKEKRGRRRSRRRSGKRQASEGRTTRRWRGRGRQGFTHR